LVWASSVSVLPAPSASKKHGAGSIHGSVPAPPLLNSELCGWWMTRKKSAWKAGGPPVTGSTPSGMITASG
jgi:hypothetical protein